MEGGHEGHLPKRNDLILLMSTLVRSVPVEQDKPPGQASGVSKADDCSGVEVRSVRYLTLFVVNFFGSSIQNKREEVKILA